MLLKEIRKELEDQGLLHLAHYRHNYKLSMEEWIRKFINELNYEKNTLNIDGSINTEAGKRRSLGDIYRVAKTYFPNISFKELVVTLFKIRGEFNDSCCKTIQKHVFYRQNDGMRHNAETDNSYGYNGPYDEFGRTLSDYTKLTLKEKK